TKPSDTIVQRSERIEEYSIKSSYKLLIEEELQNRDYYSMDMPKQIAIFFYKDCKFQIANVCPLCNEAEETVDHLLQYYFVSKKMLNYLKVEGNSLSKIKKLNPYTVDRSVLSPIIQDIRDTSFKATVLDGGSTSNSGPDGDRRLAQMLMDLDAIGLMKDFQRGLQLASSVVWYAREEGDGFLAFLVYFL
ncbi:hypothetical protein Gorai_019002, partial [Gossypium raimondii]|nr:hypothetical protein [Gossypium raimondii]